ncbi:hypothetical protein SY27_04500 [Flavobacterium sp. 316]|uniref:hypothetical protein n=1 Tax=Flavobacterium sp. 316 TaxID=1603293 RepID=UPI0005E6FB85|nr:hypothetical protein [Flavobacterium sp. 316]KIX21948.1 hypothetical protein SY27_04500 [Flavobacterium sp. 316]
MKKILTLVSAIALVFTSCSKDDDSVVDEAENILLKKTILTEGGNTETYDWTYDGNKLVSNISNDGSKLLYTYTGDLLTKIEEFDGASLEFTTNYFYNNGKLVSMEEISTGSSQKERTDYTYNSDGTVSFTKYAIVIATNATSTINNGKLFFANNNVIKREEISTYSTITTTYLYDDKKNPFMNVVGLDKLFDEPRSSKNNVVKETEVVENTSGGTTNTYITTNVYTYNASGYPITVVETQQSGDVTSYQLLY